MADEEQQEQRRQELLKLYFEFFKHFMTLSVAAAVVFLAIYKEGIADQRMVLLSLSAFGVAVVFAVPGMVLVIVQFKIRASSTALGLSDMLMLSVSAMFSIGLFHVLFYEVFGLTIWLTLTLVAFPTIEGLLIVVTIARARPRSLKRGAGRSAPSVVASDVPMS